MSYGLRIYKSDGSTIVFDSTTAKGGVYLGESTFAYLASGSYTYTQFWMANRTLRVQIVFAGPHTITTDMNGSQPRITWSGYASSRGSYATTVAIWAM